MIYQTPTYEILAGRWTRREVDASSCCEDALQTFGDSSIFLTIFNPGPGLMQFSSLVALVIFSAMIPDGIGFSTTKPGRARNGKAIFAICIYRWTTRLATGLPARWSAACAGAPRDWTDVPSAFRYGPGFCSGFR